MNWQDKLRAITAETARQGAARLSRSESQLGRWMRKLVPDNEPASNGPPPERFVPSSSASNGTPWLDDALPARPAPGNAPNGSTNGKMHSTPFSSPTEEEPIRRPTPARRPRPIFSGVASVPEFAPGDIVDRVWAVRAKLAASERFTVYLAHHTAWRFDLILKVPTLELLKRPGAGNDVIARAAQWTDLGMHPHLLYCHDARMVGGVPILVLEHADGGPILPWIADGCTENPRIGLNVAIQLCHALERLHEAGMLHGPLAADRLLINGPGMLKLANSGCSEPPPRKDAASTNGSGPPLHHARAPEEWTEGAPIDAGADIFALGVFLYELLCGQRPYASTFGDCRAPERARFGGEPNAALGELAELLLRCVAWTRAERPIDVAEVRIELCRIHQDLLGRPSPFGELPMANGEADGWNNRALAALHAGDVEEANAAWECALRCESRHLDACYNYGLVRWRSGGISDEMLVAELERVRLSARGDWRSPYSVGIVHLERGDAASALPLLEEARRLGAGGEDVERVLEIARARAEESRTPTRDLTGHRGFVSAVRISHDGRWIVSASDDHTLCLWDALTGRSVRTFEGHAQRISTLSLDGEGTTVLSGAEDALLKLWDIQSGRCVQTIETDGAVFCASISADGTRIVSASSGSENFLGIDNTVLQVWDLSKKRSLGKLSGHASATKSIAISADGQLVATGSDDQTVRVWDAAGGTCRRVLSGHQHYVSCVIFTPDGRHVVSGSWDQTIRLWDVTSGRCVRAFVGGTAIVTSIAMSGDGRSMVSGSWDGTVRIWEVDTGRCLRTLRGHGRMVTGVALSGDGRTAVSGSWDSSVRVWSVPTPGVEIGSLRVSSPPAYARLPSAAPEPDELVGTAERAYREGNRAAALTALLDARRSSEDVELPEARRLWRSLSLVCTRTDLRGVRPLASLSVPREVDRIRIADDPGSALVTCRDGRLQLWDVELERCLRTFEGHGARILDHRIEANGGRAASASADGTIRLWDLGRAVCLQVLAGHASLAAAVAIGTWGVVSGSYDHSVRLWDPTSGQLLRTFTGHDRQVTAVCVANDARFIASGAYDGMVRVWNADDGDDSALLSGHRGRIAGLEIAGDGSLLVSAAADGTIRVWDPRSARCLQVLDAGSGAVVSIQLTPDAKWAVALTADGSVRLWNLATGSDRVLLEGAAQAALAPDGCSLAVLDSDARLHVLELDWELAAAPPS